MPSGWQSLRRKKEEFDTVSPVGNCVFRIAKQMARRNQATVGENCVRNDTGELALADENKMTAWVEHYALLPNVELCGHATNSLRFLKLLAPSQRVRDPHRQSTQQNEMLQGCPSFILLIC